MLNQKGVVEERVVEEVMSASAATTMLKQKGVVEERVVEEEVMSASATSTMLKQKRGSRSTSSIRRSNVSISNLNNGKAKKG